MDNPTISILIVEDDATHAMAICRALEESAGSYRVETASSLREFHDKIAWFLPDLVIADLHLPDGKAFDLLAHAREVNRYPMLVMTAFGDEEIAVRAMKTGALDYIVKSEHAFRDMPHIVERSLREWRLMQDRKRAEEALREAKEYLENLINHANAPIIVWDPQFRITRFNRAFESLTGRRAGEVIGRTLEILFPASGVDHSMELIRKTVEGERWETVEIEIIKADGEVRTVLWNSATIFAPDGKSPVSTIAQGKDITLRKQAEMALRKRIKELTCLYSASKDMNDDLPVDAFCRRLVQGLVGAMQHPEHTAALLELDGFRCASPNYAAGMDGGLEAAIEMEGKHRGRVAVFYTEPHPFLLPEERNLLTAIAEALGLWAQRKQAEDERNALTHQLRELSKRIQFVREDESRIIAARIHDGVGQLLTAVRMDVMSLEDAMAGARGEVAGTLKSIRENLAKTITTVQNISMELRPDILDDLGLAATLEWSAGEFKKRLKIPCRFEARNLPDKMNSELSTAFYRIAQECLTNIARHARATEMSVQLACNGREVELIVRDNGQGVATEKLSDPASFGLIQMRERAITLGGTLRIESEKGKGTAVRAAIPLR